MKRVTTSKVIIRNPVIKSPVERRVFRDFALYSLGLAGIGAGYAYSIQLASSSEVANYQALFDEYRIVHQRYLFTPVFTDYVSASTAPIGSGVSYFAVDLDDANVPLTSTTLANYQNMQQVGWNQSVDISFKPKMALAAYSGTFVGFSPNPDAWIDTVDPAVFYYGLKLYINPSGSGATSALPIYNLMSETTIELRRAI